MIELRSPGFRLIGFAGFLIVFVLFCLLPLVVLPELKDPTQSGKFLVFSFCIVALTVLYCLGLFTKKTLTLNLSDVFLMVLITYLVLNRYILHDTAGFSVRYMELLGLAMVYIFLRQCNTRSFFLLFIAIMVAGSIQAIYGTLQLHGFAESNHSLFNITGSFFNPGPYAGYLASVFPIVLGVYFYRSELLYGDGRVFPLLFRMTVWSNAIYYIVCFGAIVILLILPATFSRAAWLAVIVSTAYLAFNRFNVKYYVLKHLNSPLRKILIVISFVLLFIVMAVGMYALKKGSSSGRLFIWKVTAKMINDKIWIGYGFDEFKANYMNFQSSYFKADPDSKFSDTADDVDAAFNEPLSFIAENGIIGLVLVILVILSFYRTNNDDPPLTAVAKAGLISVFIFSLFSYPSQILPIKLNATLYVVAISTLSNDKRRITFDDLRSKYVYAGKTILAMASLVFFYFSIAALKKLYIGYRDWNTAYMLYQQGMYGASIDYYKKAYPVFAEEGKFLMQYGKSLSMNGNHTAAVSILSRAQDRFNSTIVQIAMGDSFKMLHRYRDAEQAYTNAWFMIPDRFYPQYLLAKLYLESGHRIKALAIARTLVLKKPKVPSDAVLQIQEEMRRLLISSR